MINFQPGLIVHDIRKLVTSDEKKVIASFLEFRLKFLGFYRQPNEISCNEKHSKFNALLGPGVLLIFEIFQIVPQV